MSIEHPTPKVATVKYLYAHAYRCAHADCLRPLYTVDNETGKRTLNSRVCHIHSRRENGPRWDPNQTPDENRAEKNLAIFCLEHAARIDDPALLSSYPPELLRRWKAKQLEEFDHLKQGWIIDTVTAREAIKMSFADRVDVTGSVVELGGHGGNAIAAGGGGGGAIGRCARAGKGGRGGNITIFGEDGKPVPDEDAKAALARLLKEVIHGLNFHPGAGGGGAGATGDGTRAGDGGCGGDIVSGCVDLRDLQSAGPLKAELVIGKGGQAGHLPGQHSVQGEDSLFRIIGNDGTILKTIRAPGGAPARSTASRLSDGVAEISLEDIAGGFRVTALMTVGAAEIRDGLLFALGAAWTRWTAPSLPVDSVWHIFCAAQWKSLSGTSPRGFFLSLRNPKRHETSCVSLLIPSDYLTTGDLMWVLPIGATVDLEGPWTLSIYASGVLLAHYDVLVNIADAVR